MKLIILCWFAAIGIVTFGFYRNGGEGLPPCYGYAGSATIYSFLSVFGLIPGAAPLASVFAVAWTASLYWRVTDTTPAALSTGAKATKQKEATA